MSAPSQEPAKVAVERDAIPSRKVWITGVAALVVTALSIVVANALRVATIGDVPDPPAPPRATDQIGIVEQTSVLDTRRGLDERSAQEDSLTHFGWVDRANHVARIPIDRAMDLVTDPAFVQRAFPQARDGGP